MEIKTKKTSLTLWTAGIFILVGLIWSSNGTGPEPGQPEAGGRIIIFHVNDMHGRIDNFAKIARVVARERETNTGADVFFLNAGDNFSGNPIVDQYEPKGEPVRQLMNRMGFSAMTLGNHEFDYGQEILKNVIEKAKFPILCANIKVKEGPFPQTRAFTILQTGKGIKMAVLGLIEVSKNTGIPGSHPQNLQGLTFLDPIETALEYRSLKKETNAFIALTHLGFETDRRLAEKMPELDVIVGGHSHTLVKDPRETNGVLIAQAGGGAGYLGRIELIIENGRVIKKSGNVIDVSSIKNEIPELKKMIAKFNDNPALNRVAAALPRPVKGNLELGNLITDSLRRIHRLDITFHNPGGIRSNQLGKTVRLKDIYALLPFGNQVIRFEMTPDEIRSLITYDYLKAKVPDLRVSGVEYLVTASLDHNVRAIRLRDRRGRLLDEDKTYRVGMNSYMAATYKFNHRDPGRSLMVTLAETMIQYLKEGKDVCGGIHRRRTFETIAAGEQMARIGETRVEISCGDDPFSGSSPAGNLVTDAIREGTGVDIATYPGNLQRPGLIIPANTPLYKEFIGKLYHFSQKNKAITGQINGRDLKRFILKRSQSKNNADLQVSGMTYTLQLDANGEVTSVDCRLPGGEEINDAAVYKVSFNDYEFNKYYNLDTPVHKRTVGGKTVEQLVVDYIKGKRIITGSINQERIKIKTK
jgi:2',3'-cyclic-nucleotide 2'-phosphodiesterase (5'-nucleotidase family)